MKINKLILISIFLIVGLLLSLSFGSAYTRSLPQNVVPGVYTPTGSQGLSYDQEVCKNTGEDFIMQIAPFGCTPNVVRSDLLEEQDVSIFCKLVATKINPLIEVNTIDQISFSKLNTPSNVKALRYFPAQAAVRMPEQVNSPILDEMGYVQIVIGKTSETQLENCEEDKNFGGEVCWVEGNLTAKIRYNIENAWGIGDANYYLPQLSDDEFNNNYKQYSFWNGKGYLKADVIDSDSAVISVYSGASHISSSKQGQIDYTRNKITSVTLKEGERTASKIYLPEIGFCMAGLYLKLNKLEAPDTRAKLKINSDIIEVTEQEKFLENKCYIPSGGIVKKGISESVNIICKTDEGSKNFILPITPKINITIDGVSKKIELGDKLFEYKAGSVYVGFIGSENNLKTKESLYVRLVYVPDSIVAKLPEEYIDSIVEFDSHLNPDKLGAEGFVFKESLNDLFGFGIGKTMQFSRWLLKGWESDVLTYAKNKIKESEVGGVQEIFEKKLQIVGFVEPVDLELPVNTELLNYYENAMKDYDIILESYLETEYPAGNKTAEKALYGKIELLIKTDQKRKAFDLCEEFKQYYNKSKEDLTICDSAIKFASETKTSTDVLINGKVNSISFEDAYEPKFSEYGATIFVKNSSGIVQQYDLTKDKIYYIDNGENKEYIQLVELNEDYAKVKIVAETSGIREGGKNILTNEEKIKLNVPQTFGTGYLFTLNKINLEKVAHVSVIPAIDFQNSNTSFRFKVGIEKRSIQLSPEKIQNRINGSNDRVEKLSKVHNVLDTTVQTWKGVCLATQAFYTAKNFLDNVKGKGLARQLVMRSQNGWYEKCAELVSSNGYKSQEQCLLEEADNIDKDVNKLTVIIQAQNKEIERRQDAHKDEDIKSKLDLQNVIKTDDFLAETSTNVTKKFTNSNFYKNNEDKKFVNPSDKNDILDLNKIKDYLEYNKSNPNYNTAQIRDVELYLDILKSGDLGENSVLKKVAEQKLHSTFKSIQTTASRYDELKTIADKYGYDKKFTIGTVTSIDVTSGDVKKFGAISSDYEFVSGADKIDDNSKTIFAESKINEEGNVRLFVVVIDDNYQVESTYEIDSSNKLTKIDSANPLLLEPKKIDGAYYNNQIKSGAEVRYYESEPYKGNPAIVPFDLKEGWYVGMKPGLPVFGSIEAFEDSGRVKTFYLCNVGKNGIMEFFSSVSDDKCQGINTGISQTYGNFAGLSENKVYGLVSSAIQAVNDAQRGYSAGINKIQILGEVLNVGEPAVNIPNVECQDFMSPKDCNIVANACDPVVCPSSRCDFGGIYPVQDVIQSGIFGSIALCLPNYQEGIMVPVCLSGVNAGLEGWLKVESAYQDCLQTKLDTGETVGICDEIYSVYGCDFFWRQAAPIAKAAVPNLLSLITKQNTRGGGEYLFMKDAFTKTEKLVQKFTQYYKGNNAAAFNVDSVEESSGSAVCKAYMSVSYPSGGKLLSSLTQPDSPAQFHGRFDEIPFTSVTNPPVSHYKVAYFIYSGSDAASYFKVYLRPGAGGSFYQDTAATRFVDGGYIAKGEYKSETVDFTAPAGYKELCINVNGQEECGFKETSTSFGLEYVRDLYLQDQVENVQITSESECVSGTSSVFSLINPNVQSGVEEAIDPAIYNRGIVRICATENPGMGTDVSAGMENSRWLEVGSCGNPLLKCWLDGNSVENVIDSPDIATYLKDKKIASLADNALKEAQDNYYNILQGDDYLNENKFNSILSNISKADNKGKIKIIDKIMGDVFFNYQKAHFYLLRGTAYKDLVLGIYNDARDKQLREIISPVFKVVHKTSGMDLYYWYNLDHWEVSNNKVNWALAPNAPFYIDVQTVSSGGDAFVSPTIINEQRKEVELNKMNTDILISLDKTGYVDGLKILIDSSKTIETDDVEMNKNKEFYDKRQSTKDVSESGPQNTGLVDGKMYFRFEKDLWQWKLGNKDWVSVPITRVPGGTEAYVLINSDKNIVENLNGRDLYDGAAIIFDVKEGNLNNNLKILEEIPGQIPEESTVEVPEETIIPEEERETKVALNFRQAYYQYENLFEKYSTNNLPEGWAETEFRALLVAVSQKESGVGTALTGPKGQLVPGETWLMGYNDGAKWPENFKGPDEQIKRASSTFKNALNGNSNMYSDCNSFFKSILQSISKEQRIQCVLSVYYSGKAPTFWKKSEGQKYAEEVISFWKEWKSYFKKYPGIPVRPEIEIASGDLTEEEILAMIDEELENESYRNFDALSTGKKSLYLPFADYTLLTQPDVFALTEIESQEIIEILETPEEEITPTQEALIPEIHQIPDEVKKETSGLLQTPEQQLSEEEKQKLKEFEEEFLQEYASIVLTTIPPTIEFKTEPIELLPSIDLKVSLKMKIEKIRINRIIRIQDRERTAEEEFLKSTAYVCGISEDDIDVDYDSIESEEICNFEYLEPLPGSDISIDSGTEEIGVEYEVVELNLKDDTDLGPSPEFETTEETIEFGVQPEIELVVPEEPEIRGCWDGNQPNEIKNIQNLQENNFGCKYNEQYEYCCINNEYYKREIISGGSVNDGSSMVSLNMGDNKFYILNEKRNRFGPDGNQPKISYNKIETNLFGQTKIFWYGKYIDPNNNDITNLVYPTIMGETIDRFGLNPRYNEEMNWYYFNGVVFRIVNVGGLYAFEKVPEPEIPGIPIESETEEMDVEYPTIQLELKSFSTLEPLPERIFVTQKTEEEDIPKDGHVIIPEIPKILEFTDENDEPIIDMEVEIIEETALDDYSDLDQPEPYTKKTDEKGQITLEKPSCNSYNSETAKQGNVYSCNSENSCRSFSIKEETSDCNVGSEVCCRPTCESANPGYECTDTNYYSCDSNVERNYCPGSSSIVCCEKGDIKSSDSEIQNRLNQVISGDTSFINSNDPICMGDNCAQYVTRTSDYIFGYGKHFITGVGGSAWQIPKYVEERGGSVKWYPLIKYMEFKDYDKLNPGDVIGLHYTASNYKPNVKYQAEDEDKEYFGRERGNTNAIDFTHVALYLGEKDGKHYVTHLYHVPSNLQNPNDPLRKEHLRVEPLEDLLNYYREYFMIRAVIKPNQGRLTEKAPIYTNFNNYKVQKGDTLAKIAEEQEDSFGKDIEKIMWILSETNSLVDSTKIYEGTNLKIPIVDENQIYSTTDPMYLGLIKVLEQKGIDSEWAEPIYKHSKYKTPDYIGTLMGIIHKESKFNEEFSTSLFDVKLRIWAKEIRAQVGGVYFGEDWRTLGCMQMQIKRALEINEENHWGVDRDTISKELLTKDGCVKWGVEYLNRVIKIYAGDPPEFTNENLQYIFVDYNTGYYTSRNSAFQKRLNEISGKNLGLDGDLLMYIEESRESSTTISNTEAVIRSVLKNSGLSNSEIRDQLTKEKLKEFEETFVYKEVNRLWQLKNPNKKIEYATIPNILKQSSKGVSTVESYVKDLKKYYNIYCPLISEKIGESCSIKF